MTESKEATIESPVQDYQVHGVVTVITTKQLYNLDIFNPEFLSNEGVIPSEWEYRRFTKDLSEVEIEYPDQIGWNLKPQRLDITQNIPYPHAFPKSYRSHALAETYLEKFSEASYDELGLNCLLSLPHGTPLDFLTRRFSPWLLADERVRIAPDFIVHLEGARCIIRCGPGRFPTPEGLQSGVAFDCNINFPGPLTSDEMAKQIAQWKERERELISALNQILEEPE